MTAASDRAVDQLRDRILGGEYIPGERLGEVDLAEKLGVSRTPVREALRRLAAEGLVDITPNKGARVIDYPRQDLEKIFEIRAHVEGLAARSAAESASTADIDRLDELATVLKERSEAGDLDEVYRLNAAYHATLNGLSGSAVLISTVGHLIHSAVLLRTLHSFDPAARQRSVNHHLEIVAALRARDPDWAEAVMRAHLLSARASLLGARRREEENLEENA
ncbi:GntR family transcriptional regulator [Asanoa ishikariensis]|uniref:DNA-binding transcriptional regulator, GntR family n=1 Tax=Asanoa ishikariensis TaxID=137265 RepID=A0A1H3S0H3_9ACTN|nr:GntR family transcriptional regulator [Asanoa ishikariensis]GIF66619.1 GntR family transcriptional regulator [Asanoa ishikariensis]SDZ31543.1 DNA-binding transcriptional regulator, GntR family [Asanoa ishikariensis]